MTSAEDFRIESATDAHLPIVLQFITELADYEKLTHLLTVTEDGLRQALCGPRPAAEAIIAYAGDEPVGFALFFQNFSTFLGRPGLYLEDLFVRPQWRGKGAGAKLLKHLASIAVDRNYGRMEWAVLDWNTTAIDFYRRLGATLLDDWTLCRVTGQALQKLART